MSDEESFVVLGTSPTPSMETMLSLAKKHISTLNNVSSLQPPISNTPQLNTGNSIVRDNELYVMAVNEHHFSLCNESTTDIINNGQMQSGSTVNRTSNSVSKPFITAKFYLI